MIAIIDYDAGNPKSVANALNYLGLKSQLVSSSKILETLTHEDWIIIPGVGSAQATKNSLLKLGIWQCLTNLVIEKKVCFLGICVGFQILFEHSEEDDTECLGWIKGQVKKYHSKNLKIPQIGWNSINYNFQHRLSSSFKEDFQKSYFYFVNSYFGNPNLKSEVLAQSQYGEDFCAMINRENIFATQFHIEKSGKVGLNLLKKIISQGTIT